MAALAALHRALADFGAAPAGFVPTLVAAPPAEEAPPRFTRAEADALAGQAVAAAEARLAAQLRLAHERDLERAVGEALAAEQAVHAQALEQALTEQAAMAAAAIAAGLAAIRAEVAAEAAGACGRLLLPFLGEETAVRAVAALAEALREAFGQGGAMRVAVSGPAPLREALERELGPEQASCLQWREAEGPDLHAVLDGQVLETRLGAWAEMLRGSLP